MLACQHLVENDSEREQVAPLIDFLSQDLLRRHICNGSQDLTGKTQICRCNFGGHHSWAKIRFASPKSSTFT